MVRQLLVVGRLMTDRRLFCSEVPLGCNQLPSIVSLVVDEAINKAKHRSSCSVVSQHQMSLRERLLLFGFASFLHPVFLLFTERQADSCPEIV